MIFIPEAELYAKLQYYRRKVYESIIANPIDNIVTRVFKNVPDLGKFKYVDEALAFFSVDAEFVIKVGFTLQLSEAQPLILHINLPSESVEISPIGVTSGETILQFDQVNPSLQTQQFEKEEMFGAQYSISIVGLNSDLVVLVYSVLKYCLLADRTPLELRGFVTLKISGTDQLQLDQRVVPQTSFMRTLLLQFKYDLTSEEFAVIQKGKAADFVPDINNP